LLGLLVDGEAEHAVGRDVVPSAERARRRADEDAGKEIVRIRNRAHACDVSMSMRESGESLAPGETVYLLREIRTGSRIHEIGTRAHVLADRGAVLALHLDGSSAEVVTCPADHVARASERLARAPVSRAA
jgi:hypothetical protein